MDKTPQPPEPESRSYQLHESRELFRLIVQSARDFAIFTTDLDRRILTWNEGAERLTGFSEAEIMGQSSDVIYPEEDRQRGVPQAEADRALAQGRAEDERWHMRRDGHRFWGSGLMMPLRDEEGRIRGFVKILRDRTENRAAELRLEEAARELEESERRQRLLLSEIRDYGIFMLDPDGRVMTWNAGAERLKGYKADEVIGQHISQFFTEEDRRAGAPWEEIRKAAVEGRNEAEGWRVRKDGSLFWGNEIMTAIRGPEGTLRGFAKIVRDLTDRKRAEDEVLRANDELERRVQERTAELSTALESLRVEGEERRKTEKDRLELLHRLVAIQEDERRRISRELHDELKQHLAALALELKLVRESLPEGTDAQGRLERLQELTGQLGQEVHHLALELRPAALDDLGLQKTLENFLFDWSQRSKIEVEFYCGLGPERPTPEVETVLYRIVQEALTNVLKHSGASRVGVVLERSGGEIRLIVEDNGRGFNAESPTGASGRLGLLGMKERVAMVGGSISFESSPGSATTLFVRVPDLVAGGPPVAKLRVLLADDHVVVRQGLKALIEAQPDMEVVGEAGDGQAVLRQARDLGPDVVVMDISMPLMSGTRATELLRQELPAVKVLTLTAQEERSYIRQLLGVGASGFLLKRAAAEDLIHAIRTVARGGVYLDPSLAAQVLGGLLPPPGQRDARVDVPLSEREAEVLRLIALGHSNKEIAARLKVSVKTVETYKARSMEKLGLNSRAGIVGYAVRQGWLSDPETR